MALSAEKKKIIRQQLLGIREQISYENYATWNQAIQHNLTIFLQSRQAQTVALYYPFRGEPDILPIATNTEHTFCLPVCEESASHSKLVFYRWALGESVEKGKYGIYIPSSALKVEPSLIFVPCVGFDDQGYRLGYGAGWYDRTLTAFSRSVEVVGVAFGCQRFTQQAREPHDIPMHAVVTEAGLLLFN